MTTRHILSNVMRLAVAAVIAVTSISCGGDLLDTGRGPAYLIIMALQARPAGGDDIADNLLSDVADENGAIFNDLGVAVFTAQLKNPGSLAGPPTTPTAVNAITITRYRVNFRRADGRNTPGVDVPFGFDGAITATVPVGGAPRTVVFDIVRHANKAEPPLRNLVQLGGQLVISTVAEIQFFGRDQYGNEVTVNGMMDVTFGDFPDD